MPFFVFGYCDLVPIERYAAMAGRGGLMDLPPHSLIQLTHVCAHYLKVVYDLIKNEVLQSRVLHADETPHRMLEGSQKKSWFFGASPPASSASWIVAIHALAMLQAKFWLTRLARFC